MSSEVLSQDRVIVVQVKACFLFIHFQGLSILIFEVHGRAKIVLAKVTFLLVNRISVGRDRLFGSCKISESGFPP